MEPEKKKPGPKPKPKFNEERIKSLESSLESLHKKLETIESSLEKIQEDKAVSIGHGSLTATSASEDNREKRLIALDSRIKSLLPPGKDWNENGELVPRVCMHCCHNMSKCRGEPVNSLVTVCDTWNVNADSSTCFPYN